MQKPHKKLDAWKTAVDLVTEVYRITRLLPDDERYNLTSQMKRAAVSIPGNIAEGAARNTKKEFVNYLYIAKGSLSELDTYLEIGKRLAYYEDAKLEATYSIMERIDKMLSGLIRFEKTSHASRFTSNEKRA